MWAVKLRLKIQQSTHWLIVKKGLVLLFLFVLLFASQNVVSAVTITSIVPSEIGRTSVRLNAIISSSTQSTRIYFSYGTTSANFALSTTEKILPNSDVALSTEEFISGLQCGTIYYYRVIASNGGEETLSPPNTFTTRDCVAVAALIETRDATNITRQSARLQGNISLDSTYFEVSYYFEYGLNTAYGENIDGGFIGQNNLQVSIDKDVFGLLCGNNYHFRLVVQLKKVVDSAIELSESNDAVFATADCPAPEMFTPTVVSTGVDNATISVSLNTFEQEVEVFFQWGATTNLGETTVVKKIQSGTVLEQLSGLGCGSLYYFVAVIQYNGTELKSEQIEITTRACSQAPVGTTIAATNIQKNSVSISASVAANNAVTAVYFEWGSNTSYDSITASQSINNGLAGQIIVAELVGLECATKYFYRIFATNVNGLIRGQGLSFTTSVCDAPVPEPTPKLVSAKVFSGKNHSIILGGSGEVITWGSNQFFQLGGATGKLHLVDGVKLEEPKGSLPPLFFNILEAAAGGEHSLMLHNEEVKSFGNNDMGQLGANTNNLPVQEPVWVGVINADDAAITGVVSIDAGNKHSIALRKDGSILAWGDNSFGQLADNQLTSSVKPVLIAGVSNARKISAGDDFNLAILQDQSLVAWGANGSGQLGSGTNNLKQGVGVVIGVDDVLSMAAGAQHVLLLQNSGDVLVWGNNENGQLGIGNTENQLIPVALDFAGATVTQLAAGGKHSLALLNDGTLLAWGDNSFGQLGIDSSENVTVPTQVVNSAFEPLMDIISVTAGDNFTVAVDNKGNILSWGDNSNGQLNGRATSVGQRVQLTDRFGVNISLNTPRIVVNKSELILDRGSVGTIKVRLSANPESLVEVIAKFEDDVDDFFIERDNRVFFSPDKVDWPYEKTLTVSSALDGVTTKGILSFSVPGFETVEVQVKIAENKEKAKEQVVGALPPVFILSLLIYLILNSSRRLSHRPRAQ